MHGRAHPHSGQLTGDEFTGSFLAGDCTLPCRQILSVDPTGLEFPRKGIEKRERGRENLRKLTEAKVDPQLLELKPKDQRGSLWY